MNGSPRPQRLASPQIPSALRIWPTKSLLKGYTMNKPAAIGHNNPPDPIDVALEPFDAVLIERRTGWTGRRLRMRLNSKATDVLLKELKAARKAVDTARDEVTKPLHEAWKAEIAR